MASDGVGDTAEDLGKVFECPQKKTGGDTAVFLLLSLDQVRIFSHQQQNDYVIQILCLFCVDVKSLVMLVLMLLKPEEAAPAPSSLIGALSSWCGKGFPSVVDTGSSCLWQGWGCHLPAAGTT